MAESQAMELKDWLTGTWCRWQWRQQSCGLSELFSPDHTVLTDSPWITAPSAALAGFYLKAEIQTQVCNCGVYTISARLPNNEFKYFLSVCFVLFFLFYWSRPQWKKIGIFQFCKYFPKMNYYREMTTKSVIITLNTLQICWKLASHAKFVWNFAVLYNRSQWYFQITVLIESK